MPEEKDRTRQHPPIDVDIRGHTEDPLIRGLTAVIKLSVRALAVLMTVVILLGVIDVVWVMYGSLTNDPVMVLRIEEILKLFGAFLAVLIAIEIFINITIYLREDVIHVRIVMATAMMAIARKVIILDPQEMGYEKMLGLGGIVFAMSIGYWLVVRKNEGRDSHGEDSHGHAGL